MKKILFLCLVAVFLLPLSGFAQSSGNAVVDLMLSGYSYKAFNDKPVSDKDIDLILKCGIKAPSARNLQPWRFTVVKNPDVMKKIVPDAKPGNALIIVSGVEKRGQGTNIDLDCGLAMQNMYLAAQALGLGSHMYTGPIANLNASQRDLAGIPAGYAAVVFIKIGHVEKADAVSAASTRKSASELVNHK